MSTISIKVELNIDRDAGNWYEACNKISHGTDWKQRISGELRDKIVGKTREEAYEFLFPYLKSLYGEKKLELMQIEMQEYLQELSSEFANRLSDLTKHPIAKKKITLFITTFPRCPFYFDKGYIWIPATRDKKRLVKVISHEILHFQYFAYYAEEVICQVDQQKSEWLREAMTPILNDYFGDLTGNSERTYPIFEDLWQKLSKIWNQDKDFDKFIDKSIVLLKSYELKH